MHTHTRIHTHTQNTDAKGQGDFGLRWNQIVSALVADDVVFNSNFNMNSFLSNIPKFLNIIPKHSRPNKASILNSIAKKSRVLYYPLSINRDIITQGRINKLTTPGDDPPLRIVWPHRWEHDKGPEQLLEIARTYSEKLNLYWIILGQQFKEVPESLQTFQSEFSDRIKHMGYVESKGEYWKWLHRADWVLSTAEHEFFGIAVVEALFAGCLPWLPERLSYRELLPASARGLSPDSSIDAETIRSDIQGYLSIAQAKPASKRIDTLISSFL